MQPEVGLALSWEHPDQALEQRIADEDPPARNKCHDKVSAVTCFPREVGSGQAPRSRQRQCLGE